MNKEEIINVVLDLMEHKTDAVRNALYKEKYPEYAEQYDNMLNTAYDGIQGCLGELADLLEFPREKMPGLYSENWNKEDNKLRS